MRQRGFTLVEMLVALTIFALMSVLSFRGLTSVLQTREHLTEDNRRWRDLALTLGQIEQDMSMVVNRPVRDSGDLHQPALAGHPQAFGANDAQLSFSRMGMAWQTGALADVQRHGYRLNNGTIEQLVWPVLDQAPRSEPVVHALLERVNRFELRYLDGNGNWQPHWPLPGAAAGLPAALEVVVELDSGASVTRVFALP
jgi:general secretion pathway protein J